MSLFDDCQSSDSENDADYVPEYSSDEEPLPCDLIENETEKSSKQDIKILAESEEKTNEVEEKKKADDDLFRSFLADCETEMKAREVESGIFESPEVVSTAEVINSEGSCTVPTSSDVSKAVCVSSANTKKESPKLFEFAGETVCVSKDSGSVSILSDADDSEKNDKQGQTIAKKRGLVSVLDVIQNKKPKLTVLEKSMFDWTNFKKSEGITDDLKRHNEGRGFIERQRFLQRSDLRAFEIERDLRLSRNKK